MYRMITITGQLGSGKSTVAQALAKRLGWLYYSTGMAQRTIASNKGISTVELNQQAISNPDIDAEIDSVFKNPPWGKKPCVVDSRLAFHFIPNSLKVYLHIDPKVAAKRVLTAKGRIGEKYTTLKEALAYLEKRRQLEQAHFVKNYNLDIEDSRQFDLIIDTTSLTPEQVCQRIIDALN